MSEWLPEATPLTLEQVGQLDRCPTVVDAAAGRGVSSVVHFTRTQGLKGILCDSAIKARAGLPKEQHLRHVYEANAADRSRDLAWHDYVNLSISSLNLRMFNFSVRKHPGEEWVLLCFGPEMLGDAGVVFATTNNAYGVAHRASGLAGFDQLFVPGVPWGTRGSVSRRGGRQEHEPTDPQAEALYPFALPLTHLHTIAVRDEDSLETVEASLSHYPVDHEVELKIDVEAFR